MNTPLHIGLRLAAGLALSGPVLANPVTCQYGELTRKIEVVYANPGQAVPCEVIYDKSGEGTIENLWRASNEAGYCEARAAELAEKLSSTGWRCEAGSVAPGDPTSDAGTN